MQQSPSYKILQFHSVKWIFEKKWTMLLLGIDLGTSSIKVSVVDAATQQTVASAQYPEKEASIISLQTGWAEQDPDTWWAYAKLAIQKANATKRYNPRDIAAIGIAYQMHGLVIVDKQQEPLRNSIIWCDSRAVEIGARACDSIGQEYCSSCLLNSPGNFTASKLSWIKENEPDLFNKTDKIMLPGDYLSMMLTGEITTTSSALSEGIFWDFAADSISEQLMQYYGFDKALIPTSQKLFSSHGTLKKRVAEELSLRENIPVSYKAGDQLNNALSLNVLRPGEVAATAGTSGVIYAVTDQLLSDRFSRVNSFVHVNHSKEEKRLGVLLCINGAGIMNRWIKQTCAEGWTYQEVNEAAATVAAGSDGIIVLPFGNGAERMLQNKLVGAHILHLDLNKHGPAHLLRAVQECIAFSFRYGLDIMRENGLHPTIIRAGRTNMFLSNVFVHSFVNTTGVAVELFENDGSVGAALGAGIGAGIYKNYVEAFSNLRPLKKIEVTDSKKYEGFYQLWKLELANRIVE